MSEDLVHFDPGDNYPACGRWAPTKTTDRAQVTCSSCTLTRSFRYGETQKRAWWYRSGGSGGEILPNPPRAPRPVISLPRRRP